MAIVQALSSTRIAFFHPPFVCLILSKIFVLWYFSLRVSKHDIEAHVSFTGDTVVTLNVCPVIRAFKYISF